MLSRFRSKHRDETNETSDLWITPSAPILGPPIPSAPAEHYLGSWTVAGRFELRTRFKIATGAKLLDVLGAWLDNYTGSYSFHGIFTGFYIMLALHSSPRSEGNVNVYSVDFSKRVSVKVTRSDIINQRAEIDWINQEGTGAEWCLIKFHLSMNPTKRTCIPFMTLYNTPIHTGDSPPPFGEVYGKLWDSQSGYCSIIE